MKHFLLNTEEARYTLFGSCIMSPSWNSEMAWTVSALLGSLCAEQKVCCLQPHPVGPHTLFIPFPIRQANTVMTILGFTSTRSSGRAYTLAPIFRAIEIAYLKGREQEEWGEPEQQSMKGTPQDHRYNHYILYTATYAIQQSSVLVQLEPVTDIFPLSRENLGSIKLLTPSDLLSSLPDLLLVLRYLPSSCHFNAYTISIFLGYTATEKVIKLEKDMC